MVVWILTLAVAAGVARRPVLIAILLTAILAWSVVRRRLRRELVLIAGACACIAWGMWAARDDELDRAAVRRAAASAGAARIPLDGVVCSFPH
ncbi:MAG TPA: hypothetical protein VFH88_04555, partial [Candidatus Krumholzibacteria bacterium]|nr:hypothetical protein [Candidatus Krumholzibacteria bacterium]